MSESGLISEEMRPLLPTRGRSPALRGPMELT